MNKVKYPDKKVIQQQICTIIDRSGMFEENDDNQIFTEIKPVSRKHSYTRTAFRVVKVTAAAAAVVLAITAVHSVAGITSNKQRALSPGGIKDNDYSTENTAQADDAGSNTGILKSDGMYSNYDDVINTSIGIKYNKQTRTVLNYNNSTIVAQLLFSYPVIYNEKISLSSAENIYSELSDSLWSDMRQKYQNLDLSGTENNPVQISYISSYSKCGYTKNNIISFADKYKESAESFYAENFTRKRIMKTYGYNFDVANDKVLTYADIFENYSDAMDYISERAVNAGVFKAENNEEQKQKLISDNNWYLSDSEIVININGNEMYKGDEESGYIIETPVELILTFEEFKNKGIVLNDTYFNEY